jgi:hypothetical protein
MNSGGLELAPIEDWRGEEAIVVRPRMIVNIHRLPPGGATFLTALSEGHSLAAAFEMAAGTAADFDLTAISPAPCKPASSPQFADPLGERS